MELNLHRIVLLTKNELKSKGRIHLLILVISFFVLTYYYANNQTSVITNLTSVIGPSYGSQSGFIVNGEFKFHLNWFPYFYLIVCSILTSLSFSEYQSSDSAQFHLALPASKMEKFLSKALLAIVAIPTVVFLLYYIFSVLSRSWNPGQVQLGFFDAFLWKNLINVVLIQSFILYGSLTFKKFSLFKIFFAYTGLYILFNLVQVVSFVVLNSEMELFQNGGTPGINSFTEIVNKAGYYISKTNSVSEFLGFSEVLFLVFCSAIAFIMSFHKFKELET